MAKTPRTRSTGYIPDGLGPYEFWNFGAGRQYVFSRAQRSSPFLAALAQLLPAKPSGSNRRTAAGPPVKVWIPTLWKSNKKKHNLFEYDYIPFVVRVPEKSEDVPVDPEKLRNWLVGGLSQQNVQPYLKYIDIERSRFRVGLPVPVAAMKPLEDLEPELPDWQPDPELEIGARKHLTIFAIIDDGLPFAHRNFRDASGKRTRVEFCWLQSAKADQDQTSVLFGREYLRTDIERCIADHGDDEDTLYREAGAAEDTEGLASMIARHTTHGAHVMDLATGYTPERGPPAEEIRIIGVQLPNVVTMDTSGVGKDMYLLSAFHYIFHRADLIAEKYGVKRPRLVINFSYGYFGGSHDGRLDIEAAISQLIKVRRKSRGPTALVLPAGNSFLDRLHASIPDAKFDEGGGEVRLRWRLQPTDRTPNFVEVWFPEEYDPVEYSIEVRDSNKVARGSLPVGLEDSNADRVMPLLNDQGQQIGQLSVDNPKGRWRVLVATAPSDPENPESPRVEAGAWTIVVKRGPKAPLLGKESIRCWIQRDTDPASLRSGALQSFFDDPDDSRYNDDGSACEEDTAHALVRRFGTLSGLATAERVIAVSGFRFGAGLGSSPEHAQPVCYSCAGTHNAGWPGARITCSSMSDRSKALPGTVAAGTRSGSRSVLQGTSVAAPFVARQLATTFVSASDKTIKQAERLNYIKLLRGAPANPPKRPPEKRNRRRKDRLGGVLVPPPAWQPGTES